MASGDVTVRVRDFTTTPGARYRVDGDFSGEEFRDDFLLPAFRTASDTDMIVTVDLDGTHGYATSFLEETFGGLVRVTGDHDAASRLRIKTADEPGLEDEILQYMAEAVGRLVANKG